MFSSEICENVKYTYFEERPLCERLVLRIPQGFCILMNENQFSTSIKINWTKIHFHNLISLAYFYK